MKTSRARTKLPSCLLALSVVLLLAFGVGTSSALGNGYTSVVFSDGFESGSLTNWNGLLGNGSATVVASAAHTGASGLHVSNAAGQFQVLVKAFPAPMIDTSVSFWARVAAGGGVETIAQTRDDSSSQFMWGLAYDGTRQGLIFYPYRTGGSTEIFTGVNTAPAGTWFKVDVQYTATATGGGAQLYINDQTQAGWGVTGDYTRSANLQRLQLWNDGPNAVDFDDVSLAVPPGAASVPGAPTGLTGTAGNGSVNLSWTAPGSDGGSAITGYRITPNIGGTAQTPILTGSTATSRAVTGLTNGTTYTFTVAAINAAGTGPESAASAALTPSAGPTVPSAPTNVVGAPGNRSVTLSWTAPSDGGSAITGYRVTPYIGDTAQTAISTGSTGTSYTVNNLTNGTAYTFAVAAINAIGTGANSAQSAAVTPGLGYGEVVFADGFESGSLSAWNGTLSNGTAAVLAGAAHSGNYGLRMTNASGQFQVVVKALPSPLVDSSSSFWVRPAAGSGIEVLGQARDGSSSMHMWDMYYDATRHGVILDLYRSSGSDEIFSGNNTLPANTWTKVEVQYTATNGGGAQLFLNGATQNGWRTNGNYSRPANLQRLQLWNDGPNQLEFDDVRVATPTPAGVTLPSAPTGVIGTARDRAVDLSWTAPSSTGGSAISGYVVTPYIGGSAQTPITTTLPATNVTVGGLTNGTAYTFTVAAVNGVGTGPASAASAAITPFAATLPGTPTAVVGTARDASAGLTWDGAYFGRRQPDHGLRDHAVHRWNRSRPRPDRLRADELHGPGARKRYSLHVPGRGDQRRGHRDSVGGFCSRDAARGAVGVHEYRLHRRVRVRRPVELERYAGHGHDFRGRRSRTCRRLRGADLDPRHTVRLFREGTEQSDPGRRGQLLDPTRHRCKGRHRRTGARRFFEPQHVAAVVRRHSPRLPLLPVHEYGQHGDLHGNELRGGRHLGEVDVQYKATSNGGAQLFLNGQTQAAWGITGNYARTADLQRLQLWNEGLTNNDFDDVSVATVPPAGATPPGAPTGVFGAPLDRAVSVSWTAPASDGGSAITGYRITPYVGATAQTAVLTGSAATNFTVAGLTNGTAYTFTVAAVNAAGNGPDSAASGSVTPQPAPPPGAPTGLTATAGDASAALSWTAPASDGGSAIVGYRITPYIGGVPQTPINTGSTATTRTVTGLTNGTTYTFNRCCHQRLGHGCRVNFLDTGHADAGCGARSARRCHGRVARQRGSADLDGAGLGRRQRHHRLPDHAVHRVDRADACQYRVDGDRVHGHRPDQRYGVHLHGCGDECDRHRGSLHRVGSGHAGGSAANPIVLENQQQGTTSWQFTVDHKAQNHEIEGYASLTSVNKGGQISLMVSLSSSAQYTMDIYRMGWYPQGNESRRLLVRAFVRRTLMLHVGPLNGTHQATCPQVTTQNDPAFGLTECSWTPSYTLSVPASWTTGQYVVKLRRLDGQQLENYLTFTVRDDSSTAPVVYSLDVTTWNAYNIWGGSGNNNIGYDLYGRFNDVTGAVAGSGRAFTVSFDRPYGGGSDDGAGMFFNWDYPLIRFMESKVTT